ncbi:MAG: PAS domain S-box protein [Candidatus Omnitrophica bacterium]|nr:PAS domain S-box protein [Candidatus Omnitrophota bacterium]
MKIVVKITLSFLIISLIVICTIGPFFYFTSKDYLQKSLYNNLSATLSSRVDHIETYFKLIKLLILQRSKSVVFENYLVYHDNADPRQAETLESAKKLLMRTKEAAHEFYEVMLLDAAGRVVVSSDETSVGQDKSTDAYFLGAKRDVYVKDMYFSVSKHKPLMAVSAPIIESQTKKFLGVFVVRLILDDIFQIFTNVTGLGDTGEVYAVNKYGYIITPSRFSSNIFLKQKIRIDDSRQEKIINTSDHRSFKGKISRVYPNYRGVPVVGVYEYFPAMKWNIVAEMEAKEAFASLDKLRTISLIIFLMVALAAWLLGMFIARLIVEPIRLLHKGTEIIGGGNLDHKVAMPMQDEVGQLSRAFDLMAQNLKKTTISIGILKNEMAQREKVEKALMESENRFRSFFQGSRDAIMTIEPPNWNFVTANQATLDMFKVKNLDEFISFSIGDLSPEKQPGGRFSSEKAKEMIEQAMRDGFNYFDWTHKRINGEKFLVTVLLTKIENFGKAFLFATVRDITQQKQDEELLKDNQQMLEIQKGQLEGALKESVKSHKIMVNMLDDNNQLRAKFEQSSRRFKLILESSGEGIFGLDNEGKHTFVNKQALKFLGYEEQDLIEKSSHAIWHHTRPDGSPYPALECPIYATLHDGQIHQGEEYFWRKSGVGFPVEFSCFPLIEGGKSIGAVVSFRDITERKRYEEELLKLTRAVNQSPSSIVITNTNGDIEFVNPKFSQVTGYSQEEAMGKNPRVLKSGEMELGEYKKLWETIISGNEWRGEFHNKKKNGELYWEQAAISPIRNAEGKITHYLAIKEDITEFKKQSAEIQRIRKALDDSQAQLFQTAKLSTLGEMATGLAHEINQPLGGISLVITMFKKFLEKKIFTEDKLSAGIKDIETCINRMTQTITHIRSFARQEKLETQEVDVLLTIDSALILLGEQLRMREVEITKMIEPNLPKIMGEPHQLEQVWINFLSNARDAMDFKQKQIEEGAISLTGYHKNLIITLTHDKDANMLLVSFTDNGIGVPDEFKKKIFDPFFTTKEVGKGTGLGLSISYGIIESHKGRIEIESKAGEGAVFKVYLPIEKRDYVTV